MEVRLTKHLARATNDVSDAIAAAFATFATEEAAEYRQETVLSCPSSTESIGFPMLVGFLLLAVDGWSHGIHLH